MPTHSSSSFFFFFNDTATTEIYTLSLHDALPIYRYSDHQRRQDCQDLPPRKLAQCLGAAARQVTASRRGSARQGLIPPDPHEALPVLHAELEMLVKVGGRERTTDEYATLLARSGLRLAQTISLGRLEEAMWHHLIEAQPV